MAENKIAHTPGPWVAEFTGEHAATRDGFWEIAPLGEDGEPDWKREIAATADTNEANAYLIAAAPEMLDALKERLWSEHDDATHWPKGSTRDGHVGEFETCPHADCRLIAKAEGRS